MAKIGQGRAKSPADFERNAPVVLEALSRHVPPVYVDKALQGVIGKKTRLRKVPAAAVIWLVIAIGFWGDLDIPSLWRQVNGTLRSLWQAARGKSLPTKGALSRARQRVGARPLRRLFVATARPQAAAQTPGAFYKGMRLMLIDGQKLAIPDTPANARAFGRPSTTRYGKAVAAGYPQITTLRLVEAGTRVSVEAVIKPARAAEYPQAAALLKKVAPGDLVLWDRGYYGHSLLKEAVDQGKQVLGRMPSQVVVEKLQELPDGSCLADIYPNAKGKGKRKYKRKGKGQYPPRKPLRVRVIAYTINDPHRPGHGEKHRLVTTLLDPVAYPALELVALYHQRWEIEIANDEIVTHQLARAVELRSRTPCGVVQEFYGIVLAHNAVRALMVEAAGQVQIDPRALSFIHAVRVLRETIPLLRAAPTTQLPQLYQAMLCHMVCQRLPPRDGRTNPRVVKVKMSNFKKKRPEHYRPKQPSRSFIESVEMLK